MIPKINSSHGAETRNIINAAIDSINVQGKSIQDLVAEGQLTPTQYATLIESINGLIKKGDLSVYDIDINKGRIGLRHLEAEVKAAMTGNTPILSEVADGAVTTSKIYDGAVTSDKLSVDTVTINKGKMAPFVNYTKDGIFYDVNVIPKNLIYDVKVYGAEKQRIYQLESIRHGISGNYGINVYSYEAQEGNNIDTSTRKREITHATNAFPTKFTYSEGGKVGTVVSHNDNGLTVIASFDAENIGTIANIAENELGGGRGAVIDPRNYVYRIKLDGEDTISYNDNVVVDKTETDMIIYVKSNGNIYTGYHMYRVTTPWEEGNQQSNIDLWSIGRVSVYTRDGNVFTEDPNKVFIYSNIAQPTYTNDTIFKLVGANDYSGGFYHGDEKIQSFHISIGNIGVTNRTGQFSGKSLELMQHTHLYRDTSTSADGNTTAFLSVKKTHRFSKEEGYTLKTKLEALENFTPNFSSIGGLQLNRTFESGAENNITDAYNLTNIQTVNLRAADSVDKHFTGQGTMEYKVIGYFKDIVMKYQSDSEFFDTWLRNWAANEMKIYSKVFEDNKEVSAGTIVNASVNYKVNTL